MTKGRAVGTPLLYYQLHLFFTRHGFDFQLPLQRSGMVAAFILIDQLQRSATTGILGTFTGIVGCKALLNIRSDPGVEAAVPAAKDV